MKTPEFVSDMREFVSTSNTTRRGVIRIVLFVLILAVATLALTYLLMRFATTISRFSQYGYLGVFLICLISSATVILPLPGVVLWLSIVVAMHLNPAVAAVVASIGGSLSEVTAYYVGRAGKSVIAPKNSRRYQIAEKWMQRHGGLTIFLFAFFPFLIMDLAGIAAGVMKYPVRKFVLYVWLGRLPRSFIECYTYYYFGVTFLDFIMPLLPGWLRFAV